MQKRLVKPILEGVALGRLSGDREVAELLETLHEMGYKIHQSDRSNYYDKTEEKGSMEIMDKDTGEVKFPSYVKELRSKCFYLDDAQKLVYFMYSARWDDRYTMLTKSRGYPCWGYESIWEEDNPLRDKLKALRDLGEVLFLGNEELCNHSVRDFTLEWLEEAVHLTNPDTYIEGLVEELIERTHFVERTQENEFYFAYLKEVKRLQRKFQEEQAKEINISN